MPLNFPHTIHRTVSPQVRAARSGKHTTQLAGYLGAGALGDDASDAAAAAAASANPSASAGTDPNAINWGQIASGAVTAAAPTITTLLTDKFGNPVAAPKPAAAAATSSMLPIVLGLGLLGVVGFMIMKGHKSPA